MTVLCADVQPNATPCNSRNGLPQGATHESWPSHHLRQWAHARDCPTLFAWWRAYAAGFCRVRSWSDGRSKMPWCDAACAFRERRDQVQSLSHVLEAQRRRLANQLTFVPGFAAGATLEVLIHDASPSL
jgi:hypothetical protein